ncbi:hypothetical protein D3C74_439290 [compost metagenome]
MEYAVLQKKTPIHKMIRLRFHEKFIYPPVLSVTDAGTAVFGADGSDPYVPLMRKHFPYFTPIIP